MSTDLDRSLRPGSGREGRDVFNGDATGRESKDQQGERKDSSCGRTDQQCERLFSIIEEAPNFISTSDAEGNILYFNKTGRRLLGLPDNPDLQGWRLSEGTWRVAQVAVRDGVWQGEREGFLKGFLPAGEELSVLQTIVAHKDDTDQVAFFSTIAVDITEQKRVEQERARLLAIIEDAPDFVATADAKGRVLYYNKAARNMLGIADDEDISRISIPETHPGWASRLVLEEGLPAAARDGVWQAETAFLSRDGREIPVWQAIVAHKNDAGVVEYYSTIARDMTERKALEQRLYYLANHDSLTGLLNRARFQEQLGQELARAKRYETPGALLFLDLDNFKDVNDTFGHQAGDELLIRIARSLEARLRAADVVARLGGDEFAILLPHTNREQARKVAELILTLVREQMVCLQDRAIGVRASVGLATYPQDAHSVKDLLINADLAMYAAKREGGNRVSVYTVRANGRERAAFRLGWEHKIWDALHHDRFTLFWQPIVELPTRRVAGYELLLRMTDAAGRPSGPREFLAVAERSSLICAIDRWVMRRAIRTLAEVSRTENFHGCLHVNLSGKTLGEERFLSLMREEIVRVGVDPTRLVLEITETAAIQDIDRARRFIDALREMGCRFALDDFGVGFSTFSALRRLPVEFLKVDGSFIRDLSDPVNQHLVKAIIEVARGLGKQTIAELVPDEETFQRLVEYGVNYGQGYYLGAPRPIPNTSAKSS